MKLWAQIVIAIVLGTGCGFFLGPDAIHLKPIGTLFLNLLSMLIVPLIFASMTCGIINMSDTGKLGRCGLIAVVLYAVTTLIAILFGITFSSWLNLGSELHLVQESLVETKPLPNFTELIITLVPKNPVSAFAEGNVLQIIVFSIFFGVSLNLAGSKAKPVIDILQSLNAIMFRLTGIVMSFTPIGVFALMAWTTGSFGLDVLIPVVKFLLSYWLACAVFALVVFCGILKFLARLSPWPFFKNMGSVMATTASTCSSSASLPVTMQVAEEKLGISKGLTNFIMPLGCSLNMNGSALFQAMSALFLAQAYGIELQAPQIIALVTTVLMATLGTASIPGAGLLMLSLVFASVGIPLEGIAVLAGIDRLRDMATTTLNITGDAVCAVYVAKREKELSLETYYSLEKAPAIAPSQN
jgi:Na+/H+-dicarboxylate symporter